MPKKSKRVGVKATKDGEKNTGGRPPKKDKPEDQYVHEACLAGTAMLAKMSVEDWENYRLSCKRRGLHFPREKATLKAGQKTIAKKFAARYRSSKKEKRTTDTMLKWLKPRVAAQIRCSNKKGALVAIGDRSAGSAATWTKRPMLLLTFARAWHSATIEPFFVMERGLGWRFQVAIEAQDEPVLLCYGLLDGHVAPSKSYRLATTARVGDFDRTIWGPLALANGACSKHKNTVYMPIPKRSLPTWLKGCATDSVIGLFLKRKTSVKIGDEVLLDYLMPGDICPKCDEVGICNI